MKTSVLLTVATAFVLSALLPSCSAGGGVNANVGGVAKVSAGGSGTTRRR